MTFSLLGNERSATGGGSAAEAAFVEEGAHPDNDTFVYFQNLLRSASFGSQRPVVDGIPLPLELSFVFVFF